MMCFYLWNTGLETTLVALFDLYSCLVLCETVVVKKMPVDACGPIHEPSFLFDLLLHMFHK